MLGVEVQPHIQLRREQVQPVCLTTGDPARALAAAKMCESYKELAYNREFRSFEGTINDQKITIISHGVGACGAMICWEELVALGAKVIIRAGSCGSLHPDKIRTGDIHIPYAVGRAADITDEYLPTGVPAVASPRVVEALRLASDELSIPAKTGLCYSCGLFYGGGPEHNEKLKLWSRVMDTVECEFHGLFLIGLNRNVMTGGIAVVDGSPLEWEDGNYDPTGSKFAEGKEKMLKIALNACANLAKEISEKSTQ